MDLWLQKCFIVLLMFLRCWWRYNRSRVATHDRDDFISVDLQSRMEANHDVVREYASRALLGGKKVKFAFASGNRAFFPAYLQSSASLQREFDGLLKLAVARDLAGGVAVKVGVDDAEEGLAESHLHVHET